MKKKILGIVVGLLLMFVLTGCGSKTAITLEEFSSVAKEEGYSISDAMDQFVGIDYMKSATVAITEDNYQVEFYELDDDTHATAFFNNNKLRFEGLKGNASLESSIDMGNYSTYSLTSDGQYMYLSRVDNTLVYVDVKEEFKDEVKELIDKLGY